MTLPFMHNLKLISDNQGLAKMNSWFSKLSGKQPMKELGMNLN